MSFSNNIFYLYSILEYASFSFSFPLFSSFFSLVDPVSPPLPLRLPCMTPFLFCLCSVSNSKAVSHTQRTSAHLVMASECKQNSVVQQIYFSAFCSFHHTDLSCIYCCNFLWVAIIILQKGNCCTERLWGCVEIFLISCSQVSGNISSALTQRQDLFFLPFPIYTIIHLCSQLLKISLHVQ